MERDYSYAVIIGRFQPFHNNHEQLIEYAFTIADKVIVLVGSAYAAPTPKNPFTFEERKDMLFSVFPQTELVALGESASFSTKYSNRLIVLPLRDYFYSDSVWTAQVQALTGEYIEEGDTVALLGSYKDASSYYLSLFPQWEFVPTPHGVANGAQDSNLSGTIVRDVLFDVGVFTKDWQEIPKLRPEVIESQDKWFDRNVPLEVANFLVEFRETLLFGQLVDEFVALKKYKASWDSAPFPPTFVTADAVVTCSGHVLVVKRGFNPGKGTFALPGGFVRSGERIRAAAIRELKEETRIRVDKIILDSSIVDSQVFDYPDRSLRGRTITHAYHVKLKDGKLPEVKEGSDAVGAFWMPLMDVNRLGERFFEDHAHIINYFINKS